MSTISHIVLICSLLVLHAAAHSWLQCADYHILSPEDEQVYNYNNCKGWGRGWKSMNDPVTFGFDNGYNFGTSVLKCNPAQPMPSPYSNGYNAAYPMAQYAPNQNVCMAWPTKNHVAATCNNAYIPDHGLSIYMTAANPTSDPQSASDLTLVKAFPMNTAADQYVGFQHCPQFCTNNDKATCTGCFTVPSTVTVGATYTFMWAWAFNSATDYYTNCWEVEIVATPPTFTFATEQQSTHQPTTQPQTSQQQTSQQQPTTHQQTSQQQPTQPQTTQQQPTQPQTTQQQPTTNQAGSTGQGSCIQSCVALCGTRGVKTCDCSNGFNAICSDSVAGASLLSLVPAIIISVISWLTL